MRIPCLQVSCCRVREWACPCVCDQVSARGIVNPSCALSRSHASYRLRSFINCSSRSRWSCRPGAPGPVVFAESGTPGPPIPIPGDRIYESVGRSWSHSCGGTPGPFSLAEVHHMFTLDMQVISCFNSHSLWMSRSRWGGSTGSLSLRR